MPKPATRRAAQRPTPRESEVLAAVIAALAVHRRVEWVVRQNVGAMQNDAGQWVRFGTPGTPDITGQMIAAVGGQRLEVEVKPPGGWPSPETLARWETLAKPNKDQRRILTQREFLRRVHRAGGYAGVAESVDDVDRIVGRLREPLRLWPEARDGVPF